jgi:hypothetical protein
MVLVGGDGSAGGDSGTVSADESGVAGGSGCVGDEIVVDVAAGDSKPMAGRGDDVSGGWPCICSEGGGKLGVGDVGGGGQRGERTRLLSSSLSLSLRRSNSQRRLIAFLVRFAGGDV